MEDSTLSEREQREWRGFAAREMQIAREQTLLQKDIKDWTKEIERRLKLPEDSIGQTHVIDSSTNKVVKKRPEQNVRPQQQINRPPIPASENGNA